jgi:hypothetical protein
VASLAPETEGAETDMARCDLGADKAPSPPSVTKSPTPETPLAAPDRGVKRGRIGVEPGSAATAVLSAEPAALDLTQDEVQFAMRLGALIDTPRAAKRMINCYRMLRSTRYTGAASVFLGEAGAAGEHQAVLQLLALMSGFPTLFDDVARALEQADDEGTWSDFVKAMAPQSLTRRGSRRAAAANAIVGETGAAAPQWARVHAALEEILPSVTLVDSVRPYKKWSPVVARFSFSL